MARPPSKSKKALVAAGTWVEIEQVVLTPEQRAPQVPDDTRATPYVARIAGFLAAPARIGEEATVTTQAGRTLAGRLRQVNPSYHHDFGDTVPELLAIGREAAAMGKEA